MEKTEIEIADEMLDGLKKIRQNVRNHYKRIYGKEKEEVELDQARQQIELIRYDVKQLWMWDGTTGKSAKKGAITKKLTKAISVYIEKYYDYLKWSEENE